MTAEMGPVESDSDGFRWFAPLGRWNIWAATKLTSAVGRVMDNPARMHFDPSANRLTFTGESEFSGDEFARGYMVSLLLFLTVLTDVYAVSFAIGAVSTLGLPQVLTVPLALLLPVCALSSIHASMATEVVDLTTAKRPDELDELAEQYVDREIDEDELERRSEQVVARE